MKFYDRFAEWAKGFFTRDNLAVVEADIEHVAEAIGDDVKKAMAFLAVVQAVVDKVKGVVTTAEATANANTQIAAIEAETTTA